MKGGRKKSTNKNEKSRMGGNSAEKIETENTPDSVSERSKKSVKKARMPQTARRSFPSKPARTRPSDKTRSSKRRDKKKKKGTISEKRAAKAAEISKDDNTQSKEIDLDKVVIFKERVDKLIEEMQDDTRTEDHIAYMPKYLQKVAAIETGALLDLKCENYFHFFLTEHEVWQQIKRPGEFLVRQLPMEEKKSDNEHEEYDICVMGQDRPINIPINFSSARNFCFINHLSFDTPAGLVQYHYRNHIALDDQGTRLLTPIMKDSLFINHAQIAFTNKQMIGSKNAIATIRTGFFTRITVTVFDYSNFKYEQGRLEDLHRITRLAKSINHPNILKYYGIAMSQSPVLILTENCNQGTLGFIVRKPNGPDVGKRENYCYELAKGMQYLEHRFILHRNIAIDNIYVDGKNNVKIAEFSNAVFGAKIRERLGYVSMRHLAPEAHVQRIFSFKSDVWAFGVVLWEIFHNGRKPYEGVDDAQIYERVFKGEQLRLKCISDKYPNKLWKISEECWQTNADERPSMSDIVATMAIEQRSSSGILERVYESFALLME